MMQGEEEGAAPALRAGTYAGVAGTPIEIRRAALHNMQRLLPKMQLAGYAAAILHPLLRVLDGHIDELRRDAADTICAVAVALGPDFALFVPSIRRVRCRVSSICRPELYSHWWLCTLASSIRIAHFRVSCR